MFAATRLIFDPVPPWSTSTVGVPALIGVALFLAAATVATYLIGARGSWRRFAVMLSLRLAALAVVCLLLLRPSLATFEDVIVASKLLVYVDSSRSMAVGDGFNDQSRWENALRLIRSERVSAALEKLKNERRMQIVWHQGAEEIKDFDPDGEPTGNRTEIGYWLNKLYDQYQREKNVRGLLMFTDGADNGHRFNVIDQAKRWRGFVPIYTMGLGSTKTAPKRRDIWFEPDKIRIDPNPLYVKGKMRIRVLAHAPGFENVKAPLKVMLDGKEIPSRFLIEGKEVENRGVTLTRSRNNELLLSADAPETPGDYKLSVRIEPQNGEISDQNNEISTYVTVTKEGLSILWVEGKQRLESRWIIGEALKNDPRIRIHFSILPKTKRPQKRDEDLFNFKNKHYDAVVIGDITAGRFCGGDREVLNQLRKMVEDKGTGLMMLGGFETFSAKLSDWDQYPEITGILPVTWKRLQDRGQIDGPVRVVPTKAGFDHYLMRLDDAPDINKALWEDRKYFKPLQGASRIGKVKADAVVLAQSPAGDPVMAFHLAGKGRVLVFGGDTTHLYWYRINSTEGFKRFWNRAMRWLARQEDVGSDVWVRLDARRIPAGAHQRIGVTVGLRNEKPEQRKRNVEFRVQVFDPNKKSHPVDVTPEDEKNDRRQRGFFWNAEAPGEYVVKVEAVDGKGKSIGKSQARFLAYPEDLENLQPAANHELLTRIALASGGQFRIAAEHDVEEILLDLARQTAPKSRPRGELWPQWNREPEHDTITDQASALWSSGLLVCYFAFCTLICLEWYLRRRWQLV